MVDVSPGNDWSAVRVWWAPAHALGATVYPTYGFIAPGPARPAADLTAALPQIACMRPSPAPFEGWEMRGELP